MLISFAGSERRGRDRGEPARKPSGNRGGVPGRKKAVFTPAEDAEIIRLYEQGAPYAVIGEKLGKPRSNVIKRCRHLGLALRLPRWAGEEAQP